MPVPINEYRYDPRKFAMAPKPGVLPLWPDHMEREQDTPVRRAARPLVKRLPESARRALRRGPWDGD
jgi:hypothetical protein